MKIKPEQAVKVLEELGYMVFTIEDKAIILEALQSVADEATDDAISEILVKSEAVTIRELVDYFKEGHPERFRKESHDQAY